MNHIVFDTNTLRNEHFNSPRMRILKKLIDNNKVRMYIPELVKREFLSQKQIDFQTKLKSSDIIDIDKFFVTNKELKQKLSTLETQIKDISSNIEKLLYSEFNEWEKEYLIEILPFNNSNMTEVINNYFSGGTVFKSPKNRNDILDAMICTSIEELLSKEGKISVLTNDKAFREYLNGLSNVNTFDSAKALLEEEEIEKDLLIIDKKIKKYELLHDYFKSDIFRKKLLSYLISESKMLDDVYLEDEDISRSSILANSIFFCELRSADSSTMSNFIIKKIELADENEYFLDVYFQAEGSLRFGIEYYEYSKLERDETRKIHYYNMKSDGATVLDEVRTLDFYGMLNIVIKDIDSENIDEIIEYDKIDIEIDEVVVRS